MKNILLIIAAWLLFSCSHSSQFDNIKPVKYSGMTPELAAIKAQIIEVNKHLSQETRLTLAMIDYQYGYPKKYHYLLTVPNGFLKTVLVKDEDFLAKCKSRQVDVDAIDDGIFIVNDTVSNQDLYLFLMDQGIVSKKEVLSILRKSGVKPPPGYENSYDQLDQ